MSIDVSQFHQIFFEESFEGLDLMEQALMDLQPEALDGETINTIFRAAHSIKGGSATFGFQQVADFTHEVETFLDQVRDGSRGLSTDDIDLLLQSVDCLRGLLAALQNQEAPDTERVLSLQESFRNLLATSAPNAAASTTTVPSSDSQPAASTAAGWQIRFEPGANILRTGNEPLRLLRELENLGPLTVQVDSHGLPPLSSMDPERCYLCWDLQLHAEVPRAAVDDVFEWVADESNVIITPLATGAPTAPSPAKPSPATNAAQPATPSRWHIRFEPGANILRTGNEPLRLLRELEALGSLELHPDTSALPPLSAMDPEACYLCWDAYLEGDVSRRAIEEVFEWVADESRLLIEPAEIAVTGSVPAAEPVAAAAPVASAPPSTAPAAAPGQGAEPPRGAAKKPSSAETTSIRVGIDKVDNLINMVGELVITQSMLSQVGADFDMSRLSKLLEGLSQLEHNTRELQESVMRIRMLPISFTFSRFPRMVRDLSRRLDKQIHLQLHGEQTELDKTVMEKIGDPLVHLVRNAVDHGIELPEERRRAGKPSSGQITLNAYHQSGNVVIEIIDDGRGLDRDKLIAKAIKQNLIKPEEAEQLTDTQAYELIFHPGFSTAEQVSDVSGRGVGMDVVRRNIHELGGQVDIQSALGEGTTLTIRLPLTLAILDGQVLRVGEHTYICPLVAIVESLQVDLAKVNRLGGGCVVYQLRDEYLPVIRLHELFNIEPSSRRLEDCLLVVVECDGGRVGVVVDDLLAQQQVVIKSLEQNYQRVEGISGATILGDGTVSLILDIAGIVKLAGTHESDLQRQHTGRAA